MRGPSPPFSARIPILVGLTTLILTGAGVLGWGASARLQGAVIATGTVEVAQKRQVVQHPEGGVVAKISVAEGGVVAAGDVLIRLDGKDLRKELVDVDAQLRQLAAERFRLVAERDETEMPASGEKETTLAQQREIFATGRALLVHEGQLNGQGRRQIHEEIEGIAVQEIALRDQLSLIEAERRDQEKLLAGGLTQRARVLALEREAERLRGNLGAAMSARAEAETRITELERDATRMRSIRREAAMAELRANAWREAEWAARRRDLGARIQRLDIRAPMSGIVLGLRVTAPQSVIRPAEPLLYIVPQDRPMIVAARIPTTRIAEVHPGQPARLRLLGSTQRSLPDMSGHVAIISADALTEDVGRAPYYRVEIDPETNEHLRPGIPVEVFLTTASRSPLAYLLEPISSYFSRAMREG